MDARRIVESWKERLLAMARNPDYVFRNTPPELIEAHFARITTFSGYTELEIAEAERQQQIRLPTVFRTYLCEMGRSPGELFGGSDLADLRELDAFRAHALELLAENASHGSLPEKCVVFLSHQGYQFMYLEQDGGFDAPVMFWSEGESERPRMLFPSFAELVQDKLALRESNHRSGHESGGYYLTLFPQGAQQHYPARASGIRPLDGARKR